MKETREICQACNGTGQIQCSPKCAQHTGKHCDVDLRYEHGCPVCSKCNGSGFKNSRFIKNVHQCKFDILDYVQEIRNNE